LRKRELSLFALEYFGTIVEFLLNDDGKGGTDLSLLATRVDESIRMEMTACVTRRSRRHGRARAGEGRDYGSRPDSSAELSTDLDDSLRSVVGVSHSCNEHMVRLPVRPT
jgi:hypothetical protein